MSYYPLSIQKAIQIYGSQPELLGLILSSKVEEDRRKTEEAKLRQKEIDYLLQKEKKQSNLTSLHTPSTQSNRKTSIDMLLISPQTNQLKLPE
jgi:phosphopantetheine adenylyltransferase